MRTIGQSTHSCRHRTHENDKKHVTHGCGGGAECPAGISKKGEGYSHTERDEVSQRLTEVLCIQQCEHKPVKQGIDHAYG